MAERAKLKYNGRSYYDSDLVSICKKELKFNGIKYLDYTLDRMENILIAIGVNETQSKVTLPIPFDALIMYNVGKSSNDLIVDGKVYGDKKLMRIGQEVASLWGGNCLSYKVDKRSKVVIFECIEHGDKFGTTLQFSELKEYDYI